MIKKLGIAVACGIALYGVAKLINRHLVVVSDSSVEAPIDATAETEPGHTAAEADPGNISAAQAIDQARAEIASIETAAPHTGVAAAKQDEPA